MDTIEITKRLAGRRYLPRDNQAILQWITDHLPSIQKDRAREAMALYVRGNTAQQAAATMNIAVPTWYGLERKAVEELRDLMAAEAPDVRAKLLTDIFQHKFGELVDAAELSTVCLGRKSNVPNLEWIPKVREGLVKLPMPEFHGDRWRWSRDVANQWRRAYANDVFFNAPRSEHRRGTVARSVTKAREAAGDQPATPRASRRDADQMVAA